MKSLVTLCCVQIAGNYSRYKNRTNKLPLVLQEKIFAEFGPLLTRETFLKFKETPFAKSMGPPMTFFESLYFTRLPWIYDKDINEVVSACTNLSTLVITSCKNIQMPVIRSTSLQILDIRNAKKEEFNPTIQAPNLECFAMNARARITRKRLSEMEKSSPKIRKLILADVLDMHMLTINFVFLQSLDLSRSGIRDESVTKIVQTHIHLNELLLISCQELQEPVIQSDNLKVLIVDDSMKGNEFEWIMTKVNCPNLHVLGVGNWSWPIVNTYLQSTKTPSNWDTTTGRITFNT